MAGRGSGKRPPDGRFRSLAWRRLLLPAAFVLIVLGSLW